jgi:hypothetical protein
VETALFDGRTPFAGILFATGGATTEEAAGCVRMPIEADLSAFMPCFYTLRLN